MENPPQVGHLIPPHEAAFRDAIHVALAPVEAGEELKPGERIGFRFRLDGENGEQAEWLEDGNRRFVFADPDGIGIVDPFLPQAVARGDRFYMFLLPQTITSLRHEWTHPAWSNDYEVARSRRWIESFAGAHSVAYEWLIAAASDYLQTGKQITLREVIDYEDPCYTQFWRHYQTITRKVLPRDLTGEFAFRCAC